MKHLRQNLSKKGTLSMFLICVFFIHSTYALDISPEEDLDSFVLSISATDTLKLHASPNYEYNLVINWGDGTEEVVVGTNPDINHKYAEVGDYTIKISGVIPSIKVNTPVNVQQWGTNEWHYFRFENTDLILTATDTPNLRLMTSLDSTFFNTKIDGQLNDWNVSNIKSMRYTFSGSDFNQPLDNWDVSNVEDMSGMFSGKHWYFGTRPIPTTFGKNPFNQSIGNWNVSKVENMEMMFFFSDFSQPLNSWDVSSVTNFSRMFQNQAMENSFGYDHVLESWDVSSAVDMSYMFSGTIFNQDLSNWDVSFVMDMSGMFSSSKFNLDISGWNVSSVTDMSQMFAWSEFDHDIGSWDVSSVETMKSMFSGSNYQKKHFNHDLSKWDVSNVKDLSEMFLNTTFNQPINDWNVANVTKMNTVFYRSDFNQSLSSWDVSSVVSMKGLFASSPFNQDISTWDVSSVEVMEGMFASSEFDQDISSWDVSKVNRFSFINSEDDGRGWIPYPSFDGFLSESFSIENYNKLLAEWSKLELQEGLYIEIDQHFGNVAEEARQSIIDNHQWEIVDLGISNEEIVLSIADRSLVKIYPNPTANYLFIEARSANEVSISTLDGQNLNVQISQMGGVKKCDLSNLKSGVYILSIVSNSGISTSRIFKN